MHSVKDAGPLKYRGPGQLSLLPCHGLIYIRLEHLSHRYNIIVVVSSSETSLLLKFTLTFFQGTYFPAFYFRRRRLYYTLRTVNIPYDELSRDVINEKKKKIKKKNLLMDVGSMSFKLSKRIQLSLKLTFTPNIGNRVLS